MKVTVSRLWKRSEKAKHYYAEVTIDHEDGTPKERRYFSTKEETRRAAARIAHKKAQEIEDKGLVIHSHKKSRFGPFAEMLAQKGLLGRNEKKILKDATLDDYANRLTSVILPMFRDKNLVRISHTYIVDFEAELARRGLSLTSRRHHIQVLRNILQAAVRRGIIPSNPCDGLTYTDLTNPNEDPDLGHAEELDQPVWDEKQVALYVNKALEIYPMNKSPHGAFLAISALVGARLSEVLGFKNKDARLTGPRPVISVVRSYSKRQRLGRPKSAAAVRNVPLSPRAAQILREWRVASPESGHEERVFPLPYYAYKDPHRRVVKAAELPFIPFKNLRTSFITNAFLRIEATSTQADIIQELGELSRAVGHSSFEVTWKFYVKVVKREGQGVPKAIGEYGAW